MWTRGCGSGTLVQGRDWLRKVRILAKGGEERRAGVLIRWERMEVRATLNVRNAFCLIGFCVCLPSAET